MRILMDLNRIKKTSVIDFIRLIKLKYKDMKVNIKLKDSSIYTVIPKYAKSGDAGLDLTATSKEYDENGNVVYGTNLCFEIPAGYVGLLFPRSSNAKYDLINTNSVGVIDSGYRGEVMMKYKQTIVETWREDYNYVNHQYLSKSDYNIGDRIGQLVIMPYPNVELNLVDELSETERGSGSYGSTGK